MIIMPQMSRLYAAGDMEALQRLATTSARWILLAGLFAATVLTLFGNLFIAFIFGRIYETAYPALIILTVGQLFNAAFGSVGVLLNMSGHERDTLIGVAIACSMNIALNFVLIPPLGILGAAIATASTLVLWNILLWRKVKKRLDISSLALSRLMT